MQRLMGGAPRAEGANTKAEVRASAGMSEGQKEGQRARMQ